MTGFSFSRFANRRNRLQGKDKTPRCAASGRQQILYTPAIFVAENPHRCFICFQVLKFCEPLALFSISPQCPHGDLIIALLPQPTKQASGLINKRNVSADETSGLEYDSFIAGCRKGSGRSIGSKSPAPL